MISKISQSPKDKYLVFLDTRQHLCKNTKQTDTQVNMNIHIFSQMNCTMEISILGSEDTSQYASILLNKRETLKETVKSKLTIY